MKYVYSKADEFCVSTFVGDEKIALANGYKAVTDEMFEKLCNHLAHWVDGELVEREKTQTEIDTAKLQEKKQSIIKELVELKAELTKTDYQAIKFAEGWLTAVEYEPIKAQRQVWRARINELETELVAVTETDEKGDTPYAIQ